MNKKGQVIIVFFILFLVIVVIASNLIEIGSVVGIKVITIYSEELSELDSALFILLNYNTCDKEIKLPMKELLGLSVLQKKETISVDYNGKSKEINVKKCVSDLLDKMSKETKKKYDFFVEFENKQYLTISKIGGERKVPASKIIPISDKDYNTAFVYLLAEVPQRTEIKLDKSE